MTMPSNIVQMKYAPNAESILLLDDTSSLRRLEPQHMSDAQKMEWSLNGDVSKEVTDVCLDFHSSFRIDTMELRVVR